jgi:hypothetical protein
VAATDDGRMNKEDWWNDEWQGKGLEEGMNEKQ